MVDTNDLQIVIFYIYHNSSLSPCPFLQCQHLFDYFLSTGGRLVLAFFVAALNGCCVNFIVHHQVAMAWCRKCEKRLLGCTKNHYCCIIFTLKVDIIVAVVASAVCIIIMYRIIILIIQKSVLLLLLLLLLSLSLMLLLFVHAVQLAAAAAVVAAAVIAADFSFVAMCCLPIKKKYRTTTQCAVLLAKA
jgi:hypothetical protein